MSGSPISSQLRKTADVLRGSASDQIMDYTRRFESIKDIYDGLLKDLIVKEFNTRSAAETAKAFFGSNKVEFAAVDGTEYTKPLFDLLIFFGASYAATGTVEFREEGPVLNYSAKTSEETVGISSCIPMYVNEVVDAEHAFMELAAGDAKTVSKPLTDEMVVNNASIANWVMTFSEFYLAYKLVASQPSLKILFMDRSLSTTHGSLIFDTKHSPLWKTCAIQDCEIGGEKVDENDLAYSRHRIINSFLNLPPRRGDYLRYATIYNLEQKGPQNLDEICTAFEAHSEDRRKRVQRFLDRAVKEKYLKEKLGTYEVQPLYRDSWTRVKALVEAASSQLFGGHTTENPLQIEKNGRKCWLTTLDMAFLTLFSLYMLIEECWKKHVLLLGITKDTTARDFKTHLIPICLSNRIWKSSQSQELEKAPNTDRMLLQYISIYNQDKLPTPWSLIEYDSAFRMIIPELDKHRPGYVSGAIRNRISPERTFLKTYIQLSEAKSDPRLRSNVLFIDRLVYPEHDLREDTLVHFKHHYGGAVEPVDALLFRDSRTRNGLQNMIVTLLRAMACTSIPEAFGHNMPLFIADNVAKWHNNEIRRIIDSTGVWVANNHDLRQFVFYMSTFRERRSELESGRRTS